jgi:tetratricopeptide (TPR) repeat protein
MKHLFTPLVVLAAFCFGIAGGQAGWSGSDPWPDTGELEAQCYAVAGFDEEHQFRRCISWAKMGSHDAEGNAESHAGSFVDLGDAYQSDGQYDLAIAAYTSALNLNGADTNNLAYSGRGDAYLAMGDMAKAEADHQAGSGIELDAKDLSGRCLVRAIWGRPFDRALNDCNAAIKLAPDVSDYWQIRCYLRFRMGNYAAALPDCDAAIKIRSNVEDTFYLRGIAKIRSGDTAGGDADIAAATKLNYKVAEKMKPFGIVPQP